MLRTIVKLGGSLLDMPDLPGRLISLLDAQTENPVVVVGGGRAADAVRRTCEAESIDDGKSHRLAIHAMGGNAMKVAALSDRFVLAASVDDAEHALGNGRIPLFRPMQALAEVESRVSPGDHLRASWDVTSDSIAAWLAVHLDAELVLLKSVSIVPGSCDINRLSEDGFVDVEFPIVSRGLRSLSWCNFRHEEPRLNRVW